MTKDEALKQALEALENISTALREEDVLGSDIELMLNAAAAIRVALAHPVDSIASIIACRDALDAQPVPRRWVGLTNNELQPIADEYRILFGSWVEDFARSIEAKLREKNT